MNKLAKVNYHIKSAEEQAFQFDVDGVAGQLISPELVSTEVVVRDIRDGELSVSFQEDGITFKEHTSEIVSFNSGSRWENTYDSELRKLLMETVDAQEIIIFDHTVRIDNSNAERKPARNVHNDYSPYGASQRLIDLVGEERAAEFEKGHFGFVNIWRPIEHKITTSPLGFIRPASIDSNDWVNIELIYPDRRGQILGLAASDRHEWFYLSEMTPGEVAIFNIFDNKGLPGLGHSALDMANNDSNGVMIRKSIESRILIRYKS